MKTKKIIGEIFDATGHTDFAGSIDEAVATIMETVRTTGKFLYINTNPFNFTDLGTGDTLRLREALDEHEEPTFVLAGALQGGI